MEPRITKRTTAAPTTTEEPQLDLKKLIAPRQVATVMLPSRGVFYDKSLTKDGMVEISPWVGRDVKLIAGMTGGNIDDVIDVLVGRCLITKIPLSEMITTDRFFLLISLRANSFGEDYSINATCGSCGKTNKVTLKLPSDYGIEYADEKVSEPFTVVLPETGIKVNYRLPRGKDEKLNQAFVEKEYKKNPNAVGGVGLTFRVANLITSLNGEKVTVDDALLIVDNLPAKDFFVLQDAFEKSLPGIVPVTTKECVNCKATMEVNLPLTPQFFRP
jgi:hypothetical protein